MMKVIGRNLQFQLQMYECLAIFLQTGVDSGAGEGEEARENGERDGRAQGRPCQDNGTERRDLGKSGQDNGRKVVFITS